MQTGAYLLIFISSVCFQDMKEDVSWFKFIFIAILSFGSNYTFQLSYLYTSLSSAMVLSAIPLILIVPISYFVFQRSVSILQFLGLIIGLGGASCILIGDGFNESRILGNILAIIGAICYALYSILLEFQLTDASVFLYLFRLSSINFPINGILTLAVEWRDIRDYNWEPVPVVLFVVFCILLAAYYHLFPRVLVESNATEMHISLLTSHFYALLLSILVFKINATWIYLLGFLCIPIGIALLVLGEKREVESVNGKNVNGEEDVYEYIDMVSGSYVTVEENEYIQTSQEFRPD